MPRRGERREADKTLALLACWRLGVHFSPSAFGKKNAAVLMNGYAGTLWVGGFFRGMEQIANAHKERGVDQVGRQLGQGGEDESSFVHQGMGNDQVLGADDLVTVEQDVEVDQPWLPALPPNPAILGHHRELDFDLETASWDVYGRYWLSGFEIGLTPQDAAMRLTCNRLVRYGMGEAET